MGDPVLSPFVGLGLAIPGLANLLYELVKKWKTCIQAMRDAERDAELLAVRFDHHTQRFVALQAVLFNHDKYNFISGRVFDHLSSDQQDVLRRMFLELARILYAFLQLGRTRRVGLFNLGGYDDTMDVTISPDEMLLLYEEEDVVPRHGKSKFKISWLNFAWAASNKKHVENLVDAYEDWLNRIKDNMEDFWWPQSFSKRFKNLLTLEADSDFQTSGMAEHSKLRRLLLNDTPLQDHLKFNEATHKLETKPGPGIRLREIATLDGSKVMIESMPFQVAQDGFISAELQQRFCRIAALLNTTDIGELSVLYCLWWREIKTYEAGRMRNTFQLISALPPTSSTNYYTLKDAISRLRSPFKPSLSCRLGMCHVLSETLAECLKVGWRHRSICSENVLFFDDDLVNNREQILNTPVLCGFEESRLSNDFSLEAHGDSGIEANMFRHPERQGTPKQKFNAEHDIYCR